MNPTTPAPRPKLARSASVVTIPFRDTRAAGRDARLIDRPRLPNGARIEADYDSAGECWHATLVIPDGARPGRTFRGSGRGLFGLLEHLDNMYRSWLGSGKPAPVAHTLPASTPATTATSLPAKGGA